LTPLQQRPSDAKELTDVEQVFGRDLLMQIEVPLRGGDPDAVRRKLAEQLAAAAGGKREPLEQLRSRFIRRMHQAGEDFPATAGLRVTESALALVPRTDGVWAWGLRQPVRPRRRWWRRRDRTR
jgi:hypothetical protein